MWHVVQSDWSKCARTRVQINHAPFGEGVGLVLMCRKKGGVKEARHLEGGARPADHCMRMLTWKIARNDECTIIIVTINRQMDIGTHFPDS